MTIEEAFDEIVNHPAIRIPRLSQRADFEHAIRRGFWAVFEEAYDIDRGDIRVPSEWGALEQIIEGLGSE